MKEEERREWVSDNLDFGPVFVAMLMLMFGEEEPFQFLQLVNSFLLMSWVVSRDAHEKGKVEMKERKLMGKLKALNYFTKPDIYHNEISLD